MKNRLTRSILLAVGALAYHGSAAALSLSDLAVHSALNQPLRADLVLPQTDPANAQRVRVSIRPAATVDPRSDAARFVERFRPSVLINPAGQVIVEITSPAAIREPILNFVVEIRTPEGAMSREFSVLLDPPAVAAATHARPATGHAAANIQHGPQGAVYGPVQPNETLWRIANRVRPDKSVSVNRMMDALVEANPQAFINGDRNRLKAWATLKVPNRQAVLADQAQRVPETVTVTPAATVAPIASAKVTPSAQAAELAEVKARTAAVDTETQQIKARLQSLKADVASLEAQSAQRDAQIATLLAKVSTQTSQTSDTTRTTQANTDHSPKADASPAQNAQPPAASQPTAAIPAPIAKATTGDYGLAGLRSMLPAVGATNLTLVLSASLLMAALAFGAWRWRRRSRDQQGWDHRKVRDAEMLSTVTQKASERLQLEEEISSITSPRNKNQADATLIAAPTEEDTRRNKSEHLIQEADLHLAYGHFDKAEAVLKAALDSDADNLDLRFKLAETYLHAGDQKAFVALAQALHDTPQAVASRHWPPLMEMGRKLCPDNPLFDEDSDEDGVVTSAQILKFARR